MTNTAPSPLCIRVLACAIAIAGFVVFVAGSVSLTGAAAAVRGTLELRFDGVPRTLGEAASIAPGNVRLAGAVLAAALLVGRRPRLRFAFDLALAAGFAVNAALVGAAVGAYGTELIGDLWAHGSLELAAFALCAAAYLEGRHTPLKVGRAVLIAAATGLVLSAAALTETYSAPRTSRRHSAGPVARSAAVERSVSVRRWVRRWPVADDRWRANFSAARPATVLALHRGFRLPVPLASLRFRVPDHPLSVFHRFRVVRYRGTGSRS